MENTPHKLLGALPAYWPVISGVFITMVAIIKMWHSNRQRLYRRVANVERVAENAATRDELAAMGRSICSEIKEANRANSQQHQDILKVIISQKS